MTRFLKIIALVITLMYVSCDDTQTPNEGVAVIAQKLNDTLKIPKLTGLKPELKLTPEAAKEVKEWTFYKNLSLAIDSLSAPTMGTLRPRIERLSEVFREKEEAEEAEAPTTPETVQTKAIQSRILAIQTQHNILRNNSNRNIPDIDKVATAIVKVKNGFQNLNLQLNERFSMSIKDLLEEIKNEEGKTPTKVQGFELSGRPSINIE